jgi:hypothetical protein
VLDVESEGVAVVEALPSVEVVVVVVVSFGLQAAKPKAKVITTANARIFFILNSPCERLLVIL